LRVVARGNIDEIQPGLTGREAVELPKSVRGQIGAWPNRCVDSGKLLQLARIRPEAITWLARAFEWVPEFLR
jgi:hypothetical protein